MPDIVIFVWISGIAAAITGGLTIWNFFQAPSTKLAKDLTDFKAESAAGLSALREDTSKKIDALDERLGDIERDMGAIETTLKAMPTKDDLHKVDMRIEKMNTDVKVVGTTLEAVKETNDLMRDWLLKKGVQ